MVQSKLSLTIKNPMKPLIYYQFHPENQMLSVYTDSIKVLKTAIPTGFEFHLLVTLRSLADWLRNG